MDKAHAVMGLTLELRKEEVSPFSRLCYRVKYSRRERTDSDGLRMLVRQGGHEGLSEG